MFGFSKIIFASFLAVAAKAETSAWTIDSMLQLQTQHDGANCFNSVMVAKGYTDFIHQTDSSEIRYLLEKTCQNLAPIDSKQPGDIMMVLRMGTFEHAALAMNNDSVFEELGIAGILGRFDDRAAASVYRIKPISEAPFFTRCGNPDCVIET